MKKRIRISSGAVKNMKAYQQVIPAWRHLSGNGTEPGVPAAERPESPARDGGESLAADAAATDMTAAEIAAVPEERVAAGENGQDAECPSGDTAEPSEATDTAEAAKDTETAPVEEPATVASRTDIGLTRPNNQDTLILDRDTGLMGVADGMGGHNGGEVASIGARDLLCTFLKGKDPSENVLRDAVKAVNRRLFMKQQEEPELAGMGTTLTVLWPAAEDMIIGHVGDSRAYLLRDGSLRQVTADHSMVAEMVRQGLLTKAQAASHPMRNYITRAVGSESGIDVDILTEKRRKGDLWLICSDGLYGMVAEVAIHSVLKTVREKKDLEKTADILLEAALKAGGKDNISLILYLDEGVAE